MIKKSFRLMLLVAFALSSVMFVACNKYDDDIERIDNEIAALNATVQSLKAAVDGGAVITGVNSTSDGVTFTMSNGQSYKINHGTAGKDGAAGKDGSVVAIGENGNWVIDGVDTGVSSKGVGEPGKAPRINEAGNWEVYNAETKEWEDTKVSAVGASTYVVDMGSYYELNVMEKVDGENAEYVTVKLPKTASVTDIKVIGINASNAIANAPVVQLNYGYTASKLTFNDKTYAAKSYLVAAGSSLTAMVNPVDADATLFNFSLVDSKGNAPYVISNVEQHMSKGAITKADPTPNKGIWTMDVTFAEGTDLSKAADRNKLAYALAAETMNGTVSSAYDVVVDEYKVDEIKCTSLASLKAVNVGKVMDLTQAFKKATNIRVNGSAINNGGEADLTPYIVDYYFELKDETAASTIGAVLSGDELTATSHGKVVVVAHALLVSGYHFEQALTAEFKYVAPEGSLSKVEWTVTNKTSKGENIVYLPLGDLQASLVGAADNQLPKVSVVADSWTWADGDEFDEKEVLVNGVYYGDAPTGKTAEDFPTAWLNNIIKTAKLYTVNSKGAYVEATKIQDALYIAFEFDYTKVFPGDYAVKLNISKGNNADHATTPDFVVPVAVSVYAPAAPAMVKNEDYFSGDDAVVYGEPHTNKVWFDLTKLFTNYSNETHTWSFVETPVLTASTSDAATATYAKWLDATTIKVPKFSYETTADALDMIYATREYTVRVVPFKNNYIPAAEYTFNVTVKSQIAEGTIVLADDFAAAATGVGEDVIWVDMAAITAKDANGLSYNLVQLWKNNGTSTAPNWGADVNNPADGRVAIEIVLVDEKAKDNLKVYTANNSPLVYGNTTYPKFGFVRKSLGDAAQQSDITCKVGLKVTDTWGKVTTLEIPVTLKKASN